VFGHDFDGFEMRSGALSILSAARRPEAGG
jgi:hypothetical protein